MSAQRYPASIPQSEPLRKDLAYYFPLWTVLELTLTQERRAWYTAKWSVARLEKRHDLQAAGVSVLDLENRMLEVMRRKLDPQSRITYVRSAE